MITSKEIRQKFLDYFKTQDHAIIPSAPVVPENDPTVLFNTA
jgi:alanyl-tRNA synthetase